MSKHFNYSIRQIGTNVVLVDHRPKEFLHRIDTIHLSNVVNGFKATCVTIGDLDNFIQSKFYDIDISRITIPKEGIDFEILIEVSKETEESRLEMMRRYLLNADLGTDKITIKYVSDDHNKKLEGDFPKINTDNQKIN